MHQTFRCCSHLRRFRVDSIFFLRIVRFFLHRNQPQDIFALYIAVLFSMGSQTPSCFVRTATLLSCASSRGAFLFDLSVWFDQILSINWVANLTTRITKLKTVAFLWTIRSLYSIHEGCFFSNQRYTSPTLYNGKSNSCSALCIYHVV